MLLFFLSLSAATWWDYNPEELPEKVKGSIEKPIFILLYSHRCPHCHGLPEALKLYNETLGNREDVFLTMIDCADSKECETFHIHGTPTMRLIFGLDEHYWPYTSGRNGSVWNNFINQLITPLIHTVGSENELESIINRIEGGSAFLVEAPTTSHPIYTSVLALSPLLRLYQCELLFRAAAVARVTAFRSPRCLFSFNGGARAVANFLNRSKFSATHMFFPEELTFDGPAAVLAVAHRPTPAQFDALRALAAQRCDVTLGWTTPDRGKDVYRATNTTHAELPALIGFREGGDVVKFRGRTAAAVAAGFIDVVARPRRTASWLQIEAAAALVVAVIVAVLHAVESRRKAAHRTL
jgi:hypothetical protein